MNGSLFLFCKRQKLIYLFQLQPKKSPVKEAKTKLNSIAENTTDKKNVPKSVASPASKNKKDPNAPKAPLTSYFLFTAEERPKIKAEDPSLSFGEIAKLIGQRWKEVDPEDKKRYEKIAEEGKKKYDIDMAAYKEGNYNPVQNNENHEPVNDKSTELNSTVNEKKKKKDKKRPRSPSPEIATKSVS